jgi:enoyl-[acyl-carrier-protein] reductase (NADH)
MATVTIQATAICAGGNHVAITGSIAGGPSGTWEFTVDDLRQAVASADAQATILGLIRLHAIGKTAAQLKSDLQAGITVTV